MGCYTISPEKFDEEWQLWITTDHGRKDDGYHHGDQTDRERATWIATNAKGLNDYFKYGNPGIVDIMPSMAKHLGVEIPRDKLMEADGISLTGKLSATHGKAILMGNAIQATWRPLIRKGMAKVWLATTNNFKEGGSDEYKLVKEVPVDDGKAIIDIKNLPSGFYKIVMEFPHNF